MSISKLDQKSNQICKIKQRISASIGPTTINRYFTSSYEPIPRQILAILTKSLTRKEVKV